MKGRLLFVVLSLAFLFVFSGLAVAGPGSISGTIVDEATGTPILGAHVVAMKLDSMCHGQAWTDSNGHYIIPSLCPGDYQVRAGAMGYIPETYPNPVTVVQSQNTPNIDFALTPGGEYGSISGRVTDETTGQPIVMARLVAIGLDNWCYGEAWSDTGGYYAITNLCAGIYQVKATVCGYIPEIYPDSVIVVSGQNTPDINFALNTEGGGTGSISGMVTDETTGEPILGAHVVAMVSDSGCHHHDAWTDSNGYYIIEGLYPGSYQVKAGKFGYILEFYPNPVTVIEGQNTPGIDFALTPEGGGGTGSISGTVTDEMTGNPIVGAHVCAMELGGGCHGHGNAWTDSNGYYIIQGLQPGVYQVSAGAEGYIPETYPDSVVVLAGQNTPNIDFALSPMGEPGSISGTVTDANTGDPIPHAHVWAHGEFGDGQARTDSLGHYTIGGLYSGYYFVTAWACGYEPQDYPDSVPVIEGQNTPNIDFALAPHGGPGQGVIAGQVLEDNTLAPIPFAVVFAFAWHGNWGFNFTDSVGSYAIEGLQTADYYVLALAPGYIGEFYDDVYTWEEATLVTPDAYGIDFSLSPFDTGAGIISGGISSNGSSVEGAFVYAEVGGEVKGFARSSYGGGYVINGLLPGVYTVSASMVSYHDGTYPEPVVIGSGKVGEIDIDLPPVKIGDVTGEGSVDIGDVIYLINYLYISGPAPDPVITGDVNCDGAVNIADVIYLINYLYIHGPSPCGS